MRRSVGSDTFRREHVTNAAGGLDVARARWLGLDLAAQARHTDVDAAIERIVAVAVCQLQELIAGENAVRILCEGLQQVEFHGRQCNRQATAIGQAASLQVDRGAYILDYLVKTPVDRIRGFDPKPFHVHNAFRSPGQFQSDEIGRPKAEVYQKRYESFRKGPNLEQKAIDGSCEPDFAGVTFAFVCIDSGSARAEIFDLLIRLGIPFVDVGMGLVRINGALAGMVRTDLLLPGQAQEVLDKQLIPLTDPPGFEYRQNIQIAELNALNASFAMLCFKQYCGFYARSNPAYHLLVNTAVPKLFVEPCS